MGERDAGEETRRYGRRRESSIAWRGRLHLQGGGCQPAALPLDNGVTVSGISGEGMAVGRAVG